MREIIQKRWNVEVRGRNYPPGFVKSSMSRLVMAAQMSLIVLAAAGDRIFSYLNMAPHGMYSHIRDNKWQVGIGAWLVGNIASNSLISTGAFEIEYNGRVLWSKLDSGKMPSVQKLIAAVDEALEAHLQENADDYRVEADES